MITLEAAIRILEFESYSSFMIKKAIDAGVLEVADYKGIYSSYSYAITLESFHNYLYQLGLTEKKIDNIFDNIQIVS